MNCTNLCTTLHYLHASVPQDQIIPCLTDALIASFTPEECAILQENIDSNPMTDPHHVLMGWVNRSLSQPDWQLAQRVLPLLLSRLESHLTTRRTDA